VGVGRCSYLFLLWDRIHGKGQLSPTLRMGRGLSVVQGVSILTARFNERDDGGSSSVTIPFPPLALIGKEEPR
jgi:hypothetical protein